MNYKELIGTKLGQFDLKEVIGVGGMGAVYRAYQSRLERDVAVKVLPAELGIEQSYIDRFIREAKIVAKLEHPNIIPIYGFDADDELTYVAMRLLTGGSLMDRLAPRDGREPTLPSVSEAAHLLRQMASALDYAHSKGIIHRDIKPGNIMFDQRGDAYLLDFGIAKLTDATQALTIVGTTMGTPIFMAPEQWRTEEVSPNTDQYAMGVLMYFTLVGTPPFQAATAYLLMELHMDAPVPPIHRLRNDIPPELGMVIERAMSKQMNDRFPSMQAFADAFDQAIKGAAPSEPTQFFRPQGIFADTNKEPQAEPPFARPTVPRRYTAQPTTPATGIRIPDEQTARRNPPPSAVETYQGDTPLPVPARQQTVRKWLKSPITWLLIAFFLIFGAVAYLLVTSSDPNTPSLTDNEKTETASASTSSAQDNPDEPIIDSPAPPTNQSTDTLEPTATEETTAEAAEDISPTSTAPAVFLTTTPRFSATPSPTISPTPEPESLSARITGDQTNVRAGPNVYFSIVDTLERGQMVDLYLVVDGWGYIGFDERYAWVLITLLNVSGDIDDLPASNSDFVVQCTLADIVRRYNSEWTAVFWKLGCRGANSLVITAATVHHYQNGILIEADELDEVFAIRDDSQWTIYSENAANSNSVAQFLGDRTPAGTTPTTLYIQRYQHGYIYDLDDETDVRILLDSDRVEP